MKRLLCLFILLSSCGLGRNTTSISKANEPTLQRVEGRATDLPQNAEPGKCYQKVTHNGFLVWSEVICEQDITKEIIAKIHTDLERLNYSVDQAEVLAGKIGPSTKQAIKTFQIDNKMAFGGLDRNTLRRLGQ